MTNDYREQIEAARAERQRRRRQKLLRTAGTTGLVLLLLLGAGLYYFAPWKGTQGLSVHVTGERMPVENHFIVLVMGMDAIQPNRTDTIMLLALNSHTGHVGAMSIPRDTRVMLPGRSSAQRINVAHAIGGENMTVQAVESLLGISIDYWARVHFDGFQNIVNTLGGVKVDIASPMKYTDEAQNLYIDLPAGTQKLDGEQALHFVRYRADNLGDVSLADPQNEVYKGRVVRQLQFVESLAKQALQPSTLVKAPSLIPQILDMVDTNVPLDTALRLVSAVNQVDVSTMEQVVLPGEAKTIGGGSYWVPNEGKIKEAVNRVLLGRHNMTRVVVLNGSGQTGVAAEVAQQLRQNDYFIERVGNADNFNYERTLVYPLNSDHTDRTDRLLHMLEGQIVSEEPPVANVDEADVVVIIGTNYNASESA